MDQAWQGRDVGTLARAASWNAFRPDPSFSWQPRFRGELHHPIPGCRIEGPISAPPPVDATVVLDEFVNRLIEPDADREAFGAWAAIAVADLLALLTPAARRLGDMWLEDECSFCDVTIGMHRLTLLLIDLESADAFQARPGTIGRALISPAPGDQHGFGTALVGLYLRRAGWDVTADVSGTVTDITTVLSRQWFDLAGFSVGHERAIEPVSELIRAARRLSHNRGIRIAVGGPMIVGNDELAKRMGADLWADDAAMLVDQLTG